MTLDLKRSDRISNNKLSPDLCYPETTDSIVWKITSHRTRGSSKEEDEANRSHSSISVVRCSTATKVGGLQLDGDAVHHKEHHTPMVKNEGQRYS